VKIVMNGHNSQILTPSWPGMRGYGTDPVINHGAPQSPQAGPDGTFRPDWGSRGATAIPKRPTSRPERGLSASVEAPGATETSMGTSDAEPTPQEMLEAVAETMETMEEGIDQATAILQEAQQELPEDAAGDQPTVTATEHPYDVPNPEVQATASDVPSGEYVGGTEIGPEAGNGVTYPDTEEEKSRWPLYVGVGAGIGLLGLLGLAAWGASK